MWLDWWRHDDNNLAKRWDHSFWLERGDFSCVLEGEWNRMKENPNFKASANDMTTRRWLDVQKGGIVRSESTRFSVLLGMSSTVRANWCSNSFFFCGVFATQTRKEEKREAKRPSFATFSVTTLTKRLRNQTLFVLTNSRQTPWGFINTESKTYYNTCNEEHQAVNILIIWISFKALSSFLTTLQRHHKIENHRTKQTTTESFS